MDRGPKPNRLLTWVLIAAGCTQMAGYVFQSRVFQGFGFAYGVGPLPTVFSTVNGVEGISTRHTLFFTNHNGRKDTIRLGQEEFSHFRGSYFLKNSYSLFLAYPHVLKPEQVSSGMNFLLCKRNLGLQFNIRDSLQDPSVQIERIMHGKHEIKLLESSCKE